MKKNLTTLFVFTFLLAGLSLQAQFTNAFKDRTRFFTLQNAGDFIYFGIGGTFLTEAVGSPVFNYRYNTMDNFVFVQDANSYNSISMFRAATDLRVNLVEYFDMLSLSLNFPLGVSFNLGIGEHNSFDQNGILHLPAFLQLNMFNHSTHADLDEWGGYIGFGYQYFYYLRNNDRLESDYDYFNHHGKFALRLGITKSIDDDLFNAFGADFAMGMLPKRIVYATYFDSQEEKIKNFYFSLTFSKKW